MTSFSSAGPALRRTGRMSSGLMGLVLFGLMCGNQVPAGRSYQGVDVSPWNEGSVYGGSFAICSCSEEAASVVGTPLVPLSMAARSRAIRSAAKYALSSHRSTSVSSFLLCLGALWNEAADATSAGRCRSQQVLSLSPLPSPATIWCAISLTMYRMCRRRRLALGFDVAWLLFWLLASATRYRPREVTRALDGATLVMIQDLHAYSIRGRAKEETKPPF